MTKKGTKSEKPQPKKSPVPELQVTRNCGHCGAAKHIFPSKMDETVCDLCGAIEWI